MGMFKFHKKANNNPESDTNQSDVGSENKSRGKFHTRRKKKSLISQMKISESVPATVIDAVHGDKSVVNSDKDFVRATALTFSDGVKYPVFVMDEATLEDSGLGERANKDQFGQVSVGLKTSSGASGFLPVVTTESLEQQYITLLPMHDAFEVLNDFPTFSNYKKGWLVGLLSIDNDELQLELTDVRIPMAQWWAYVNGELNFKVENDKLKLDVNVPTTADPLKLNDNETGEITATREFEDDDGQASNSSISSFFESDGTNDTPTAKLAEMATDDAGDQGFAVSDFDELDELDDTDAPSEPENSDTNTNDVPESDATDDDDEKELTSVVPEPKGELESTPASESAFAPEPKPVDQPKQKNPYVEAVSRDDLEADNAIMTASVRTLTDLKVSVSDREFLDAYLNPLSVTLIPLADETNDPTGRIHHENELRRKANIELTSILKERKARLRQWFETQRSSMLDALHNKVQEDGSQIKSNRQTLKELQRSLNDDEGLRLQAEALVKDDLDELDTQFEKDLENAKQQALVEVEAQFNQKRVELTQHKNDIIQQGVATKRQEIANNITEIKHNSQEYAQTAASKIYMEVMEQGAMEFRKAEKVLETAHRNKIAELEAYTKQVRDDENKRVADQADIARHDTTIAVLNERIKEMAANHKAALEENEASYRRQLETVQAQATSAQQVAVGQVQEKLAKAVKERDDLKDKLDKQMNAYDAKLEKRDAEHRKEIEALRDDAKQLEDKFDRDSKRRRNGYLGVSALMMLLGLTGGFATGSELAHNSSSNNNSNFRTMAVPVYSPQGSNSSSEKPQSSSSQANQNSSATNSSQANSSSQNASNTASSSANSATSSSASSSSAPSNH